MTELLENIGYSPDEFGSKTPPMISCGDLAVGAMVMTPEQHDPLLPTERRKVVGECLSRIATEYCVNCPEDDILLATQELDSNTRGDREFLGMAVEYLAADTSNIHDIIETHQIDTQKIQVPEGQQLAGFVRVRVRDTEPGWEDDGRAPAIDLDKLSDDAQEELALLQSLMNGNSDFIKDASERNTLVDHIGESGRGSAIIEQLACARGFYPNDIGGKTVWALFPTFTAPARQHVAVA